MNVAARILTALVALEHIWFLVLEMFLWTKPIGMKTFGTTPEFAQASAGLAANQGLYNGFLAAGLIWALLRKDGYVVQVFFLVCMIVAGVYGGLTAKPTIVFVQAAPALLALILTMLARRSQTA